MKTQNKWITKLLYIPLMFALIFVVYAFRVPNPAIILIIPVVYFVYSGGYTDGLISGITVVIYNIYFFLFETNDPAGLYKVINIILAVSSIVFLVGKLKMQDEKKTVELKRLNEIHRTMATTDKLTGASNRHAFFEQASTLFELSEQLNTPLSVLFIDIDHFKQVNDMYGHAFGDVVLAKLSNIISHCICTNDINCRYGGDEFVVLLANADSDIAQRAADCIMEEVYCANFAGYSDYQMTVCVGISTLIPLQNDTLKDLIDNADYAMYRAKQAGRNCVRARKQN